MRVLLRVRDRTEIDSLKKYGSINYISPAINLIGMTIEEQKYDSLINDINVIHVDKEAEGSFLMPV